MLSSLQPSRLRAGGIHLLISMALAAVTGSLILGLWFPPPYLEMSGGLELLWLLIGVDVAIGPLLTLVVFNTSKPRSELVRDLSIIAALQIGALAYGLYTTAEARPVVLVFEQDRFRIIAANNVLQNELPKAQPAFQHLSLTGPVLLGTREPRSSNEKLQAIDLALAGYDIGQRPSFWVPYDTTRRQVLEMSRPLSVLLDHYPKEAASIRAELGSLHIEVRNARFLPAQTKRGNWVVLLDAKGTPVGFSEQDGFF